MTSSPACINNVDTCAVPREGPREDGDEDRAQAGTMEELGKIGSNINQIQAALAELLEWRTALMLLSATNETASRPKSNAPAFSSRQGYADEGRFLEEPLPASSSSDSVGWLACAAR